MMSLRCIRAGLRSLSLRRVSPSPFPYSNFSRFFSSSTTLPIIDISPFRARHVPNADTSAKARQQTANQLHAACRDVGFFYITNHGVSEQLLDASFDQARRFFSLPQAQKDEIRMSNSPVPGRGYQHTGENVTQKQRDWHEALDFMREIAADDPDVLARKPLHGPNLWPRQPSDFRSTFVRYVDAMNDLGTSVMEGIAVGLGLPVDTFKPMYDRSFWVMRVISYPPKHTAAGENNVGFGCGEHTDYGCLTIVNQDSSGKALQVKGKDGEWLFADPIPGAFVMNIGDMLDVWTNGLYKSTAHRVISPVNPKGRISIPFFFEPNFDAAIEPFKLSPEVVGNYRASHPRQRVVYGEHLMSKVNSNYQFDQAQPGIGRSRYD